MEGNKMAKSARLLLFSLLFVSVCTNLEAYNDEKTHPDLSEFAARKSKLSTSALLNELIPNLEEYVSGKKAFNWIRDGAELEDAGSKIDAIFGRARFKNHFHNPLKAWFEAGLSDVQSGQSMVLWSQDSSNQSQAIEGDYSWKAIRNYYYGALIGGDEQFRQENFARVFRGLGHQMHLIEDAAQPDHVRNDAHPLDGLGWTFYIGYEKWAEENESFIRSLAEEATFPDLNLDAAPIDGLVPITRLFDANLYSGYNPSASLSQGLSEYSNANFFSDDTVFAADRVDIDPKHYFPYPRRSSTDLQSYLDGAKEPETYAAADGEQETAIWISKTSDGEIVDHFLRPSFFTNPVHEILGEGDLYYETFYRDEKCHEDYARKLIPRAVGYSAALIDYFFRGQMTAQGEEITDTLGNVAGFKVQVLNTTPGEVMGNGQFILSYRYKPSGSAEYVYGLSSAVSSGSLAPPPNGCSRTFSFDLSQPIPSDATETRYTMVFQGTLGQEVGAVVGKVVELAPVGFSEEWNAGLQGSHFWLTTDSEIIGQNPDNGKVVNEVWGGRIVKENVRFAGTRESRVNQTYIGEAYQISSDQFCMDEWGMYCVPYDFGADFPLSISPCTRIRVKIDEMSTTEGSANPDCGQPGSFQGLILRFDNGISLAFTVPGQEPWIRTYYTYIQPGYEISFNIFEVFAAAGVEFIEPVNLVSVDITQQMWTLCESSTTDHRQRMVVDHIRLED
jgi:hypothetical protein